MKNAVILFFTLSAFLLVFTACNSEPDEQTNDMEETEEPDEKSQAEEELTSDVYMFQLDTIDGISSIELEKEVFAPGESFTVKYKTDREITDLANLTVYPVEAKPSSAEPGASVYMEAPEGEIQLFAPEEPGMYEVRMVPDMISPKLLWRKRFEVKADAE